MSSLKRRLRVRLLRLYQMVFAFVVFFAASMVALAGDFYISGNLGFDRFNDAAFMDVDCDAQSPNALYGCGKDDMGVSRRASGDFDTANLVGVGVGYALGATRLAFEIDYRSGFSYSGTANFLAPDREQSASADISTLSGMFAGYVDLDKLSGVRFGRFSPFVGVGIGLTRNHVKGYNITFPVTQTVVPDGKDTEFAWMATAGVSVAVRKRLTLDLAYRYSDMGEVRTGSGGGSVDWRDGSRSVPLDLAPTFADMQSHGIRLSLRYAL